MSALSRGQSAADMASYLTRQKLFCSSLELELELELEVDKTTHASNRLNFAQTGLFVYGMDSCQERSLLRLAPAGS